MGRSRRPELLALRAQTQALETQLQELRNRRLDARGVSAWEALAKCQRERRERAVLTNAKLRRLVDELTGVAQRLERLVTQTKATAAALATSETMPRDKTATGSPLSTADEAFFWSLFQQMQSLYVDTDRIAALFKCPLNTRRVDVVHDRPKGLVLKVIDAHALPFSWQLASTEVWQAMPQMLAVHEDNLLHSERIGDDRLELQLSASIGVSWGRCCFHISAAVQRFTTSERTVIIVASRLRASDSTDLLDLDGISIQHRTWFVLSPLAVASGQLAPHATRMAAFTTLEPVCEPFMDHPSSKMAALHHFLESAISSELAMRHHCFEDRLLKRQALLAVP